MSWTFTTSGSAIAKAGLHANSTIINSGSVLAKWSDQAEGRIEGETRRTWITDYTTLSDSIKNVLEDITSSMVAKQIMSYDPTGYLNRELNLMINIQDDIVREGLRFLKDFKSNTLKAT